VVLDSATNALQRQATHTWLTYPDINVKKLDSYDKNANRFILTSGGNNRYTLSTLFFTDDKGQLEIIRGATSPYVAWIVLDNNKITKTNAFKVSYPANNSWAVAVWQLLDKDFSDIVTEKPTMLWNNRDSWSMELPLKKNIKITRNLDRLMVESGERNPVRSVQLISGPNVSEDLGKIRTNFTNGNAKFEKFRDLTQYRYKMTYFLFGILALQIFILILLRWKMRRHLRSSMVISLFGWLAMGLWLQFWYFA
jgi:hypothetical protein